MAIRTSWDRVRTPVFENSCCRTAFTNGSETPSVKAISLLVLPANTARSTRRSRGVKSREISAQGGAFLPLARHADLKPRLRSPSQSANAVLGIYWDGDEPRPSRTLYTLLSNSLAQTEISPAGHTGPEASDLDREATISRSPERLLGDAGGLSRIRRETE